MLALALILILVGVMLIHASLSGKAISDLIRGTGNIKTGAEPTLKTD